MKSFCLFILLSSHLGILYANCPAEAPEKCKCESVNSRKKVECDCEKESATLSGVITSVPSWIPNDTQLLDLIGCNINNITNDTFKNLTKLTRIRLQKQSGGLSITDSDVFQGLDQLERVNLDENFLSPLPGGLFANLMKLKVVSLNQNALTALPDDLFQNSNNVETLNVAQNSLTKEVLAKIGEGKFGKSITGLLMTGTPIADLTAGFFRGLPELKNLGIANCNINYIRADVLKGTKLENIDFEGNPIRSIDDNAFAGVTVKDFKCSKCSLTSSIAFGGFLNNMRSLKTLHLQNNQLTSVPKNAFSGLKELHFIILRNNTIDTIEENPFLDLEKCVRDTCIQLQDNPLNCSCKLAWFRKWANDWSNLELLKCSAPASVAGKSFKEVEVSEFCCANGTFPICSLMSSVSTTPTSATSPTSCTSRTAHVMIAVISQLVVLVIIPFSLA